MEQLDKAIKLAVDAHAGQTDLSGVPYILHVIAVATALRTESEDHIVAAVLHDIVEDTDVTLKELINRRFSEESIMAVDLLTHPDGMDYFEYIERLCINEIAMKVKLADLKDNKKRCELAYRNSLNDKNTIKFQTLLTKYIKAIIQIEIR